jgi:RNA-directed DNA polymerase
MTTVTTQPMDGWNTIDWKEIQRHVFKLQTRIYRASSRGDVQTTRKLQRLLTNSRSAKLLAVRRVTQDNQGKKTAGVDGVKALTPSQRLTLVQNLKIDHRAKPVRRVWIPKPGTDEQRPLGIPTIHDRALQTLVKAAIEPEWEARFEPNSYGFRPGRSCHDAIEALQNALHKKPKYALDADIAKCFDRISHEALLRKLNTSPTLRRQIKVWLKAGVMDGAQLFPSEQGTMQWGTISPLLANVALHGMERLIIERFPTKPFKRIYAPQVIRYADDLVILHEDLNTIRQCQESLTDWLREMGLELKASKTRITHTLTPYEGTLGFDFLGFHIRQYPVGKTKSGKGRYGQLLGFKTLIKPSKQALQRHLQRLREMADRRAHIGQAELIKAINPVIRGWTSYYSTVVSHKTFETAGHRCFLILMAWARRRHPSKSQDWIVHQYWKFAEGRRWLFQPPESDLQLTLHRKTRIKRHVKVQGARSPYDGDWVYWSSRLGRHPEVPPRVAKLLKRQKGHCQECGLFFTREDVMEVDHILPKELGGSNSINNCQLLHRHCHDRKTARERKLCPSRYI